MPEPQTSNVWTTIKTAFGSPIINGQLNPVRLKIATRGYWIQSRIFHIPDRFGFFSPGPPLFQVYEALALLLALFDIVVLWALAADVYVVAGTRTYVPEIMLVLIMMSIWSIPLEWVRRCWDHRRSSDYDWAEDSVAKGMMERGVDIKSQMVS